MATNHLPEGFGTVTPYLMVTGAPRLLEFLEQAFGANVLERSAAPDGTIMHAALKIGDSMIEMSDASGQFQPLTCALHVYVPDADAVYKSALQAGGKSVMEPVDQFYGDREAGIEDPSGNQWFIATHKEDVPDEEMQRRMEAYLKEQGRG